MSSPFCFACLPERTGGESAARIRRLRPACIERGSHRPGGPVIEHEHRPEQLRFCRDCRTLVVEV